MQGLNQAQVEMVKSAVAEMMQDRTVFAETVKNAEGKLKDLLTQAGANESDIEAITNYIETVETDIDGEDHIGCW